MDTFIEQLRLGNDFRSKTQPMEDLAANFTGRFEYLEEVS
jgi:hypothetical protein